MAVYYDNCVALNMFGSYSPIKKGGRHSIIKKLMWVELNNGVGKHFSYAYNGLGKDYTAHQRV